MNLELFIARKIHFEKNETRKVSPPAIRIAITGVTLGLAVMILAVAIVIGFKEEVRNKVIGFGSHIQIATFDNNQSYETHPIAISQEMRDSLCLYPEIKDVEPFATKPGILKTDDAFLGVAIKGVDSQYNWDFFKEYLVSGSIPQINDSVISNEILISKNIADKLHLGVGDQILCYFVQDNIRARKFKITGIYQTYYTDYDKIFIIGDIKQVQRLNNWKKDQYSGLEIRLKNFDQLNFMTETLYFKYIDKTDKYGENYYVRSVKEQNSQLFSWLDFLDTNVWVILILMSLVAGFTMISGLLIIILEHTNMIGILKALGANNITIRKIFLYVAVFLVGKGMLWGNIIGLGLCAVQYFFKIIKLDPEVYYITSVPIEFNFWYWLLLNISSLIISVLMLIGPSYLVSLIRPAKSIKYE